MNANFKVRQTSTAFPDAASEHLMIRNRRALSEEQAEAH